MKDPLLFVDIVAWIVFLFQLLVVWAGIYDVSKNKETDIYPNTFLLLFSMAWLLYRWLS